VSQFGVGVSVSFEISMEGEASNMLEMKDTALCPEPLSLLSEAGENSAM
jgi:hypothetical protein